MEQTILNEILKMSAKIDTIADDVSILKSDVATLKSDVATLKSDVATLKSNVAALQSDVAILQIDVDNLKSKVSNLDSEVASLKSEQLSLRELYEQLNNTVTRMEYEHGEKLRILFEAVTSINQKHDEFMTIFHSHDNRIYQNEIRISALELRHN